MEAYPPEYVEHNVPLVLLSGLDGDDNAEHASTSPQRQESGTKIINNAPTCKGEMQKQLLEHFMLYDGSNNPWNSTGFPGPTGPMKFKVKQIGRTYVLPPRKAAPPPQSAEDGAASPITQPKHAELHSPLSPWSPGSPIFPDGVFTPLWFRKHQQQVPALVIAFFNISSQGSVDDDEVIKNDINSTRTSLSRSGFKTRFAAVLLSDTSIVQSLQLDERLSAIRRSTSLDSKTGFFFMPPMSSRAEIATFVQGIVSTLQSGVVDYYRDLTKHARRKKVRGSTPNPAAFLMRGTSQSLSNPGWNVRYEVKQGAFAEFRQELDVAERHYSVAIDELFNDEGIFEATASWSPRWTEARLLCDTLAWRVIRCQLWMGETTGSVQSWINYRLRMRDLIDRRGKGCQTYGWEAWEARWALMMAQLIYKAELPAFTDLSNQSADDAANIQAQLAYALPEKTAANPERLPPFELLHRPAYWHFLSAKRAQRRWWRAQAIPEEDRSPPGQTPASSVASRTRTYDTYLVPEPHEEAAPADDGGYDHLEDIAATYSRAVDEFSNYGQYRMAHNCTLELALHLESAGRLDDAMQLLIPLWQTTKWRHEKWHNNFLVLLTSLKHCTMNSDRHDAVRIGVMWELLHRDFASQGPDGRPFLALDTCLEKSRTGEPLVVDMKDRDRTAPISTQLSFDSREGHVGEPIMCQLIIDSVARHDSNPVTLSEVLIELDNACSIVLSNETASPEHPSDYSEVRSLTLQSTQTELLATSTDLNFNPGQRKIFNFSLTFREARVITLAEIRLSVRNDSFHIHHTFTHEVLARPRYWIESRQDNETVLRSLNREDAASALILPKPPKVQMLAHHLRKRYYCGELIRLEVELVNHEMDTLDSKLIASSTSDDGREIALKWSSSPESNGIETPDGSNFIAEAALPGMVASSTHLFLLVIYGLDSPGRATLNLELRYTLQSDPDVPMTKSMAIDLTFVPAFEVKFTFSPLVKQDPWPSFFDANTAHTDRACGIPCKWRFGSQIIALANEEVFVRHAEIELENPSGDIECSVAVQQQKAVESLSQDQRLDRIFELVTQKKSLDDRRTSALESSLVIQWSLSNDGPVFTTRLPAPRLTIPSSEPRVLCSVDNTESGLESGFGATLHYYLENPSLHFLTFAITMEASEHFGFGGPKHRTLSLAPVSRHLLEYQILAYDDGDDETDIDNIDNSNGDETGREAGEGQGYWLWPNLQVVDSYYQKNLRVQAAGPGLRNDEKGRLAVWVGKS